MKGAIYGDIIGSRFEFDRGPWSKEFELFTNKCSFTDDSVMSVAVAEALMNAGIDGDEAKVTSECVKAMQKWGRLYPNAGYGGRFRYWLIEKSPKPYNSWGNGSAMRVSPVGWAYDSLERTMEVAGWTAEVTHNHPEGIKGAKCTAAVMFLARSGKSKEEIKEYVISTFGYDLSTTVAEYSANHRHDESCMDTLPKALVAFFEGVSYEDVIRNAISMGGDTDTIAAIAGAMADAFYGIPEWIESEGDRYVGGDLAQVLGKFAEFIKK